MDNSDQELDGAYTRNLAGSLILAALFNWGLLGVLTTQTYGYYIAFPRDRILAKSIVYTVLVIELGQTIVVSHDIFMAFASSFGDISALDEIRNHWFSIPVCGGISGGIGQFFFAYRIWMMSERRSKGGPLIIGTFALASVVSALISARAFFHAKFFSTLLINSDNGGLLASIGVWNGIGAICDITIALCMPYYLMRHGTGMRRTHVMIVKLVGLIIETGGLTAVIAILHLCLYFANLASFIVPGLTVSKIYANTMLVILNNRMRIVDGRVGANDDEDEPDSPSGLFRHPSESGGRNRSTSTIIVSHDRLVFRLNDMHRTNSRMPSVREEDLGHESDGTRKHSTDGDTSSVDTRSPIVVKALKEEQSIHCNLPSENTKV